MAHPPPAPTGPADPQSAGRRPLVGIGLVLLAATLWGTLGTVYTLTIATYHLTPLTVVFYRALFATLAIGAWILVRRPALLRVRRADWGLLGGYGLLGVTIFYVAYIYAIVLVGVTTAVVLLYTAPAIVALLAWRFLGESLTRVKIAALGLTFAGVVLVAGAYNPGQLQGNALGLGCGLLSAATYALYSIFGKLAHRRRVPLATLLFYTLGLGCLGLLAIILGQAPATLLAPGGQGAAWGVLVLLGTAQTLAPVAAYTISLRHLDAGVASICATLEPVVAGLLAFLILHEPLGAPEVAGAALILLAVALLQSGARRRPPPP
ncbi:MAG TPA: EamA family transporter [Chloroflexia bacterium]|nr:EamA family transporter [Chloroflexia bacterium]